MLTVTLVERDHYLNFVETHPYRNFMQYPSWSDLKAEWKWLSEFVGWFNSQGVMVGGAVILYRKVPGLNKYLAYIPRGPIIDWFAQIPLKEWFYPLFNHLKQRHVFSVKMDPPLVHQTWSMETIINSLQGIPADELRNMRLHRLKPDRVDQNVNQVKQGLAEMGWKENVGQDSFDTVQPQYVFRLNMKNKTLDEVYNDFHPLWQQKIQQAEQNHVTIKVGTEQDLPNFHHLLTLNARREQSQVRDISYFKRMFEALTSESPDRVRLYMASRGNHLLCAALAIHVNGQTWDLYSARSDYEDDSSVYLMRWKMIQDSYNQGDRVYDFRGISNTLNASDPLFGYLQFRMGFGGDACELMGEWDFPVIPMLHWAFDMYMKRR
ncbi:lipid II:glycine glycyltransferase FemX [Hazenella coriacea]|uniref:Lipid II:glycine glycyltransferase n=1 Tax=Hazenella coriacea TaxID=1179467 RepID=A0A4R3LDZ3_9BACL|nr:peptidoglycan bridge formation glycyltransferase FemA/FemB family protein [Hazenella coriacea]TCS96544.1 FemAB family protein [Hazenella coriacea]